MPSGRKICSFAIESPLYSRRLRRRNLFGKLLKKVLRIVRSRAGLGVVLNAERAAGLVLESGHSSVVQIHVGHLDVCRQGIRINRIAVVLRRDGNFSAAKVLDRLVGPAVAEF